MHWGLIYIELLLVMAIGLTQGSHFSRDESSEDAQTEFNLASTLKGGISSNRHHARAHLNSQLYPEITQLPSQQPSAGYASADIDEASAHERGGSGIGTLNVHVGPPGNRVVAPGNQQIGVPSIYPAAPVGYPAPPSGYPTVAFNIPNPNPYAPPDNRVTSSGNQRGVASTYPASTVGGSVGYPAPPSGYPTVAFNIPNPSPYPAQYLPQYTAYPQPAPYPVYPGYPGQQPGLPPQSYQNQQHFAPSQPLPRHRDHFDRSFTMNTEYKEDGVHKGPFEVLNNHKGQGYGSGYGGGYNGAFNRPGY
ncbi:hypothetical protein ACLKA6_014622 [Drosophila palustris]